jgi:uncharacterized surface protein with fasciclin (FAS1) repeats
MGSQSSQTYPEKRRFANVIGSQCTLERGCHEFRRANSSYRDVAESRAALCDAHARTHNMMSVTASIARVASVAGRGRVRRGICARRQAVTAPAGVVASASALGDNLTVLSAAVEKAELLGALTGDAKLTVFAPTDAAFAKMCEDLQMSKEQILEMESLADILAYHVVPGTVTSADLKNGEVATLNERFALDIEGTTVNGAKISKADGSLGNLTVHEIDAVCFPPWSVPAKVLTPQQVLAFEGWAPEVINGRLAMLGFLTAVVQEIATGQSFTEQFGANFGIFAAQVQLWAFASLVPAFSSNEGYTANPFTMENNRTWKEVFKGGPWDAGKRKIFSPEVEQLNGRAAMVGIVALIAVETAKGSALF